MGSGNWRATWESGEGEREEGTWEQRLGGLSTHHASDEATEVHPPRPLPPSSGMPSLKGVVGMKSEAACVICARRDGGAQGGSWTRLEVGSSLRREALGLVLKMNKRKGSRKGPPGRGLHLDKGIEGG